MSEHNLLGSTLELPECWHKEVVFFPTPELIHHGKEICRACGKFVRWVPKPETLQRRSENAERLAKLRKRKDLTVWERSFLLSLEKNGLEHLSPRQQEVLNGLAQKPERPTPANNGSHEN
jgi:hypothetical protein